MTDSIAMKPKKRTTIYIDPNIDNTFAQICLREGESKSEKIEGFIARYIAAHEGGNPNLKLTSFIEEVKRKCYFCEAIAPALRKVKFISGLTAEVCPKCLEDKKSRGLVKRVVSC